MEEYMKRYLKDELDQLNPATEAIIDHLINIEVPMEETSTTTDSHAASALRMGYSRDLLRRMSNKLYWVLLMYTNIRYNVGRVLVWNRIMEDKIIPIQTLLDNLTNQPLSNPSNGIVMSHMINQWLAQMPFSSNLHEYIQQLYASIPDLRYNTKGQRNYNDLVTDPIQFYKDLKPYNAPINLPSNPSNLVPLSEQLLQLDRLDRECIYGQVYYATFAGDIPMFAKISDEIEHEYIVGRYLNEYYDQCPFFMYTYGLSDLYIDSQSDGFIQVLDNVSDYMEPQTASKIGFFQWLDNIVPLKEYLIFGVPHMINEDGKVIEVSIHRGLMEITKAVLATFKYLFHELGFVHGDIHCSNIQLIRTSEPQIIELPGYPGKYFNLDYVPTLIDYGFSSLIKRGVCGDHGDIIVSPLDERWTVQQQYIMDVDRYIRLLLRDYNILRKSLGSDLIHTMFISLTGMHPTSSDIYKIMSMIYGTLRSKNNNFFRTLPPGFMFYNPDKAIDWLIDKWDNNVPLDEHVGLHDIQEFPNGIDDQLQQLIDENKLLEVYSYPSAIVALQDPQYSDHTKVITEKVDNSIKRIDCMNEDKLKSNENLSNTSKLQYVYRSQVIGLIDEFIESHIDSPNVIHHSN